MSRRLPRKSRRKRPTAKAADLTAARISSHSRHPDTARKILDTAAREFARSGFRQTTVRTICRAAGANIASINYHFRNKAGLYRAVLSDTAQRALQRYPRDMGLRPNASPEERLHAFIRSFLCRILDPQQASIHGRLMSREMVDPTGVLDDIVEHVVRPNAQFLMALIRELAPAHITDNQVEQCAMSVVSQCLFQHQCRPVIQRLFPHRRDDLRAVERLADHIWQFSLNAIRSLPPESQSENRT
ncbi:MAG TPA: CerR family C-terminal domain-containing protein [Phycisphaerales bacterium]|nr:CerR family C-terminal domain-containing protein [Phycisphaerales bacterium]